MIDACGELNSTKTQGFAFQEKFVCEGVEGRLCSVVCASFLVHGSYFVQPICLHPTTYGAK